MNLKKIKKMLLVLVLSFFVAVPVYASDTPSRKIEDRVPVNPNSTVTSQDRGMDYKNNVSEIQDYIHANISENIFASLHLDKDANGNALVVLSFTREIPDASRKAILALADDPDLVVFRTVQYSQNELQQKQKEIDQAWSVIESQGIKIHYTGINVFTNRVEIGVSPYHEVSVKKLKEQFGSDMIDVIEGYEVTLLGDIRQDIEPIFESTADAANVQKPSFLARIVQFFKSLFNWS